jgi:hypothetical protein
MPVKSTGAVVEVTFGTFPLSHLVDDRLGNDVGESAGTGTRQGDLTWPLITSIS